MTAAADKCRTADDLDRTWCAPRMLLAASADDSSKSCESTCPSSKLRYGDFLQYSGANAIRSLDRTYMDEDIPGLDV